MKIVKMWNNEDDLQRIIVEKKIDGTTYYFLIREYWISGTFIKNYAVFCDESMKDFENEETEYFEDFGGSATLFGALEKVMNYEE